MVLCVIPGGVLPPMLPWELGGGKANLYLYPWRDSDKLLVDESKFYSVLLCIPVTKPLLFVSRSSQVGAIVARTCVCSSAADKTGLLHDKGRKQKHRWRWHRGSDVASLWGILHLELHECCFVSSQTTNCGVNFWWPYFPPCLGFSCSITWRISPKKITFI